MDMIPVSLALAFKDWEMLMGKTRFVFSLLSRVGQPDLQDLKPEVIKQPSRYAKATYFSKGQALVTLLFFVVIAVTVTSAAVILILNTNLGTSKFEQGTEAYYIAESGMENALLRMLRDPNYTGEVLSIGGGTATIQVTGTDPKIATSEGKIGTFDRKVEVVAGYVTGIMTVNSWKEIQ
jgi:hypothetical protein